MIDPVIKASVVRLAKTQFRRNEHSGWCEREDVPDGEDFCSDHQPKKRSKT